MRVIMKKLKARAVENRNIFLMEVSECLTELTTSLLYEKYNVHVHAEPETIWMNAQSAVSTFIIQSVYGERKTKCNKEWSAEYSRRMSIICLYA